MLDFTQNSIILSYTPFFGNSKFSKALKNNIDLHDIINSPDSATKTLKLRQETISFLKEKKYLTYLEKINHWLNK